MIVNGYTIKPDADLCGADLSSANLYHADLRDANLSSADLSGAKGLLSVKDWLNANFKKNKKGYIVYKAEGDTYYPAPKHWKNSRFITEVVNPNRTNECGCGVNFATKKWIYKHYPDISGNIWLCRIEWLDLGSLVVPYNTDGKARCARLRLVKQVK